ncbi:MAG TPA: membrane or secreted protein [Planctomycetaceae bacterium]|nr:membrane or secreted protein [Planctomycetaceae bacterium]
MSQVSPYARSTAERTSNRNATVLFTAVSAAIFFAALWLFDPSNPSLEPDTGESSQESLATSEPPPETRVTNERKEAGWAAEVAAIERQLPRSDSANFADLRFRLQALLGILEAEDYSPESAASIRHSLDELRQHAMILSGQTSRPNVDAEGLAEGVSAAAQSMKLAEQELLRDARERAERQTRQRKEPALREVRLALRDNQDKAAGLRRQIARLQQEQSAFEAKAARAAALHRDMADVQRYLQPFTAPGYLQPKNDRNAWDTERTVDAKPVSLARLKRLGALDDTMEGLKRLYIFGGGKNPVLNNSRPLGSFPQYWAQHLSKPEVRRAVERAQQLLRDHGQALVEEQLLSP